MLSQLSISHYSVMDKTTRKGVLRATGGFVLFLFFEREKEYLEFFVINKCALEIRSQQKGTAHAVLL